MSKLRCHISISLDGFVAGPNQSEENLVEASAGRSLQSRRSRPTTGVGSAPGALALSRRPSPGRVGGVRQAREVPERVVEDDAEIVVNTRVTRPG